MQPNSAETLPSYPLRGCWLTWEIYDEDKLLTRGERFFNALSSMQTVSGQVEGGLAAHKLQLYLALVCPTGEIAAEKTLDGNTSQQDRQLDNTSVPVR